MRIAGRLSCFYNQIMGPGSGKPRVSLLKASIRIVGAGGAIRPPGKDARSPLRVGRAWRSGFQRSAWGVAEIVPNTLPGSISREPVIPVLHGLEQSRRKRAQPCQERVAQILTRDCSQFFDFPPRAGSWLRACIGARRSSTAGIPPESRPASRLAGGASPRDPFFAEMGSSMVSSAANWGSRLYRNGSLPILSVHLTFRKPASSQFLDKCNRSAPPDGGAVAKPKAGGFQ
jgi:hypothetical protein